MAFLTKLVYCIAIAIVARALPTTKSPALYQIEEFQDSYNLRPTEDASPAFAVPTNLQLPKSESSQVPFYVPDLTTALKAPQYSAEPTYYEVPIPAQDLVAPNEQVWNPEADPKLYFAVPAVLAQPNVPTNDHPKKFNKDLHVKSKPYSSRPKYEVLLEPADEKYYAKQQALGKVYNKLAKKENQKELQQVQKLAQPKAFHADLESEGAGFEGASADLTAAFGGSSHVAHSSPAHGERQEFHMAGHDGPHSYKWGYDTGKGHNRQFRYEERDKEGIVKGHFGFYDKHGKLQMIKYDAHPHEGYHADGNFGKY